MTSPFATRYRWGTTRLIAVVGGTAAASTAAFGINVVAARIATVPACHVLIATSSGSSATSADPLLPANSFDYLTVSPGMFVSAVSAGTSTGNFTVTELS